MTQTVSIGDMMKQAQSSANTTNNSKTVIKSAIMDMVASLQLQKSEAEHQTAIAESLKQNHQIPIKVSKRAAKIIFKGKNLEDQEIQNQVDQLVDEVLH